MPESGDHPYWFLAVFLVAATLFALIPLGLARLWALKFSPAKPGEQKNATYECGIESTGPAIIQFKSQYYLFAILFLIFDGLGLGERPAPLALSAAPPTSMHADATSRGARKSYQEAIQYLYDLRWFGTKLGLENTLKLAELAGNPHQNLQFIHIAGTNGKGSTCAMLESIYREAGRRVGLFTSPHLVTFSERIQVNRQLIPEDDVVRWVSRIKPWIRSFPADAHPTFFEAVTMMALGYFVEQQCDLVIWETGLGGRLDATNIVTPLASVITNIQFDHEKWLGNTLREIAREKSGIIKPGVPVLTATTAPEALEVIAATARQAAAPLAVLTLADIQKPPLDRSQLPLLGEHQRWNAALAVATVETLAGQIPVSPAALKAGLERVRWAGRLQVVTRASGQTILLDGAHNPAGAESLRIAVEQHFPGAAPALIIGLLQDKDRESMCRILAPMASRIFTAPIDSDRTATADSVAEMCRHHNPVARVTPSNSLGAALQQAEGCPFVIVAGSLHFLGEAMELLHVSPTPSSSERALNEWNAARLLEPVRR
jgi:dihydrofolate synthase / folylpolyglutamate synthase